MKTSHQALGAALLLFAIQGPAALADPQAAGPSDTTATATKTAAPEAASPSAPSAAPAAASQPPPGVAPATAAQTSAPKGGAELTSELREKHFKAEGYHVKTEHGQKYYCRTEIGTGSHIPKEQCYTEDALARAESHNPSSASMGSNGAMPRPPQGGGGG